MSRASCKQCGRQKAAHGANILDAVISIPPNLLVTTHSHEWGGANVFVALKTGQPTSPFAHALPQLVTLTHIGHSRGRWLVTLVQPLRLLQHVVLTLLPSQVDLSLPFRAFLRGSKVESECMFVDFDKARYDFEPNVIDR